MRTTFADHRRETAHHVVVPSSPTGRCRLRGGRSRSVDQHRGHVVHVVEVFRPLPRPRAGNPWGGAPGWAISRPARKSASTCSISVPFGPPPRWASSQRLGSTISTSPAALISRPFCTTPAVSSSTGTAPGALGKRASRRTFAVHHQEGDALVPERLRQGIETLAVTGERGAAGGVGHQHHGAGIR